MRTNLIKYYTIVFCLFFNSILLAQPGTDTTDGGNLEVADTPPASIDVYVWLLMGIGLVFAFFIFKSRTKRNRMINVF